MLSVIASIISFALGLVLNKVRHSAADKLKDGDVIDKKLRDVIIEDLNDIKTKIDGLSRTDLLASYCLLKEGVVTLNLALDEAKDEEKSKDEVNIASNGGSNTTTTTRSESESGVLNEAIALTQAIQKLSHTANSRLVSAKECFKTAREEATRAFSNEGLSLPDRILAAQLRVVSKILECLEDTKAAVAGCMLFLEDLHNLPAIRETFSTYFKGGMKSRFYKNWRLENVMKPVLSLNFAISEFVPRFSGELPNVRYWPRVHLPTKGETIHPLLIDIDVVREIFDQEEFQMPENQVISSKLFRDPVCINSKGQILWSADSNDSINILNRSGDIKTFCQLQKATRNQKVNALVIDRHDNVFVIIEFNDYASKKYVLFVFDSTGNQQYEHVLDFLKNGAWKCVVNNDGYIIIQDFYRNLYVCDSNGNLKPPLSISARPAVLKCVTDENEIVMSKGSDVLIFTKEGELKRTINVKNYIQSVTFNYVTSKIEVLVKNFESVLLWPSYSVLSYTEKDEVECLYLPVKKHREWPVFFSHPAGPAAFEFRDNETCTVVFL